MNRVQIAVLGVTVMAFGGAYALFNFSQGPAPQAILVAPRMDTDEVLVAARDLAMGTQLAEPDFTWQKWPTQALSELMIKKSEGAQAIENVKGAVTRNSFLQGEPMRRDKLIKGPNSGFLSAILPSGMRAVAINIDQGGGASAGGFILPNDRVDVIRVYRDEEQTKQRGVEVNGAQTILTNVRILAIAQSIQEKGTDKGTVLGATATLELTPEQAELIVLAQRAGGAGNLHLTLRSMLDAGGKTESVNDLGTGKTGGLTIVRAGSPQQASR
ncbi:MAG: Flp pilus assembly protein CpaB [Pseudomonadota bacterium]|nr:Flp pilus assembly protein CpaB [Pseudomonadota bacterium]